MVVFVFLTVLKGLTVNRLISINLKLNSFLALFSALLLGLALSVPSQAAITKASLAELLTLSGYERQIMDLPSQLKQGVEQGIAQRDPDNAVKLAASIEQFVDVKKMRHNLELKVQAILTQADVDQLLVWYRSELGKKITAAEVKAGTMDAFTQMQQQLPELMKNAERVALAKQMDVLIRGTEQAMQMQESVMRAVFSSIMKSQAPDMPVNAAFIEQQLEPAKAQMRPATQQMMVAMGAFTYQTINVGDVERYIAFLQQAPTKKLLLASEQSLTKDLALGMSAWAADLGKHFKQ